MDRLAIDRLGHHGDGIAQGRDGPVYVPRALPGEVVEGARSGDRIPRPRILTPSPDRVTPPCPHYRACGGCSVMHASDAFVADWKVGIVRTALAAQRLEADIAGIATSPPATRRRAVLSARRLKSGPVVGFHAPASDLVTDIPGCRVLTPGLLALMPALRELTTVLGSRKGMLRLAVTDTETGGDVTVEVPDPGDARLQTLADIARRHDLARLTVGGEPVALRRAPLVRFDGIAVAPPPGAFLQATRHGEDALRTVVAEATRGAARIADLFAGCGTFALPLARGAEVHAVEAEPALLAALDRGWRQAAGLKRVTTEVRDLFRRPLLSAELSRFDAVVIDPPRAGAEAQSRALAASRTARIAAISCSPASFARDARILVDAGFAMGPVTVVDQFRWSAQVELAAAFTR